MKKKLCCLFLIAALLLALLPASAFAAELPKILVSGVELTPGNTTSCGSGTASYAADGTTLTLTNATITDYGAGVGAAYGLEIKTRTLSPVDMTIVLVGENKIEFTQNSGSYSDTVGLYSTCNLTFTGSGSLTVNLQTTNNGVTLKGILVSNGGTLTNQAELNCTCTGGSKDSIAIRNNNAVIENSGKIIANSGNGSGIVAPTIDNKASGSIRATSGAMTAVRAGSCTLAEGQSWAVSADANAPDAALEAAKFGGNWDEELLVAATDAPAKTAVVKALTPPAEEEPAADVPKTGDLTILWIALSLSVLVLAGIGMVRRERRLRQLNH